MFDAGGRHDREPGGRRHLYKAMVRTCFHTEVGKMFAQNRLSQCSGFNGHVVVVGRTNALGLPVAPTSELIERFLGRSKQALIVRGLPHGGGQHRVHRLLAVLRDRARVGQCDVVLVEDLGRLGRNQHAVLSFVETIVDAGSRLVSVADGLDTADLNWRSVLVCSRVGGHPAGDPGDAPDGAW